MARLIVKSPYVTGGAGGSGGPAGYLKYIPMDCSAMRMLWIWARL